MVQFGYIKINLRKVNLSGQNVELKPKSQEDNLKY